MSETYFERFNEAPPNIQLQHLIYGGWISRAIGVAAELGIADLLADGPKRSDELAHATDTHPRALYRLMRTLANIGVFTEVQPETFGLTPIAEWLRTDAPGSLRGMARHRCGEVQWRAWGQLEYSVRTGQPAFERVHGMNAWEYREQHPDVNALFNAAMTSDSAQIENAVIAAYDFSEFGTVVDVGGGHGGLLVAILHANPHLRGVLFDLHHVAEGAEKAAMRAGVFERCDIIGGDMF